ncbi:MAG: ABC transporter permease [Candidatus Limnocylindrales bacterium]
MTTTFTSSTTLARTASLKSSIFAFVRFELRRALRNRRYLMFSVAFPVVFYLLYTTVLQTGGGATLNNTAWAAYFMVSMAAYAALGASLAGSRVIASERAGGWTRQLRAMPMAPSVYVLAKLVVSLVTSVPAMLLVMLVGVLANGVSLPLTTWLELVGALVVGSLPFAALGILLGYLFDGDGVQGAFMVTYFSLAILGGLWTPVSALPPILVTIAHVLPSFHFGNLGWEILAGRGIDPVDIGVLLVYGIVIAALVGLRYRTDEQLGRG